LGTGRSALQSGLSVGDRKARTDRQRGELKDRSAAGAPIRELGLAGVFVFRTERQGKGWADMSHITPAAKNHKM
jgi:hypothetical protein